MSAEPTWKGFDRNLNYHGVDPKRPWLELDAFHGGHYERGLGYPPYKIVGMEGRP